MRFPLEMEPPVRRLHFTFLFLATCATAAASAASELSFAELAHEQGFDAMWSKAQELAAGQPAGKKRDRALLEAGFSRITMPVAPIVGASLNLSAVQPLGGCVFGESVECAFTATGTSGITPRDFRIVCKSSFGGTIALTSVPIDAQAPTLAWRVSGLERCWKIGGVSLAVMPAAHADLEGVGAGDDFIPPELAMLSQVEADQIVAERTNQFRYCAKKNAQEAQKAKGILKVRYAIAADGTVSEASPEEVTFEAPSTQQCILDAFRRIRFPPPGGGFSGGTYPITLL
jgi:hypothetical protein